MDEAEIFFRLAFLGLALILFALTLASWHRTKESKILLAALSLGAFAVEGIMLALGIFSEGVEEMNTLMLLVGINLLALIFLYMSVLKR
jgi:hypothetical protein